ncbi:Asp-tRNA(Asn)/Glu-tRNA(Gln) amidotransferase subunit GatC [bacterium]|nr:Asp-tRNA(Asn)/Glu-tRNA(Gln) amidotransferase subunit GatC [bacterium]
MFTREEVLKIATLARLELSAEEVERYQKQLGRVLEYVQELKALPTQQDAFVKHIPRDAVAFRGDKVLPFTPVKNLLDNAPALEDGGFLLPTTVVEHT